jgi:hypothetical protein
MRRMRRRGGGLIWGVCKTRTSEEEEEEEAEISSSSEV